MMLRTQKIQSSFRSIKHFLECAHLARKCLFSPPRKRLVATNILRDRLVLGPSFPIPLPLRAENDVSGCPCKTGYMGAPNTKRFPLMLGIQADATSLKGKAL